MKKLLLMLAVLFLLAIVTLAVFLVTFDADRFRPQLVSQLQAALQRPVSLEHISLGWQRGIAVQFQGLVVEQGTQGAAEPLIQVESAHALVHLMPLLHKRVEVASITLTRPRIVVARDAQGRMNLMGLAAAASPAAASGTTTAIGGTPVSLNIASLRIQDGALHWLDAIRQPPADVWIKALDATVKNITPGQPMDVEVKGALAATTQNFFLRGRLTPPSQTQPGSVDELELNVKELPLDQILPPARPREPQLRGTLTTTLHGSVATLDPVGLTRTLSGSGDLALANPKIVNLNVLRRVFEQLSMLPGLMQTLEERLPPEYQAKFAANDTVLEPINLSITVRDGALHFDDVRLSTDTFRISGSGTVGLEGLVSIRSTLRIDPTLSGALIKSVKELQYLTDTAGGMEIPLTIEGQMSRLAVLPDLNYVASKLLTTKVQDLLGTFLQKALEKNAPPESTPQ